MPWRLPGMPVANSLDAGSPAGLRVIGVYKLGKAAVLLVLGVVILRMAPTDMAGKVSQVAALVGIDPRGRLARRAVERLSGLSGGQLSAVGAAIVLYGCLYVAQGVGLLMLRRWGEYLAVVNAGLLIPFEVYEMFHTGHFLPAVALSINVLILAYLANRLLRERTANGARDGPT